MSGLRVSGIQQEVEYGRGSALDALTRKGGAGLIYGNVELWDIGAMEFRIRDPVPIGQPKESSPNLSDTPGETDAPHCSYQRISRPFGEAFKKMEDQLPKEERNRQDCWHRLVVELGEAIWSLAQLAVFLFGMGKPLHQAVLMDESDASTAFARVEQGLFERCFPTTDSTVVTSIFTDGVSY